MSANSAEPIVDFQDVSFKYVPRDAFDKGSTFDISKHNGFSVRNVTLKVFPGDRCILVAANGQGKSTLLSCVAGKRKPQSGSGKVLGRDAFSDTSLQEHVALIASPWPSEALFSCKVEAVVSPCADEPRRDALARALHLPMQAQLNKMSSGQKRRVQILHGLMTKKKLILMDECSTDIDVAERVTLMNYVKAQCEESGAAAIYATHIVDGVQDWATRIVMMDEGCIVRDEPFDAATSEKNLEETVTSWLVQATSKSHVQESVFVPGAEEASAAAAAAAAAAEKHKGDAVAASDFSFRDLFESVTHTIPRGSKILLAATNGAGKSTLLSILSGNTFFKNSNNELTIFSRPCFQDTLLHNIVSFGGNWWPAAPEGEMYVKQLVVLPLDARAERLRALLAVDLEWDVRYRSTGELKRIQLLMKLQAFRPVVLLDEATADLDIHMRANLLRFLREESDMRGVTIVYVTHILEALGDWPSDILITDRNTRKWLHYTVEPKTALVSSSGKNVGGEENNESGIPLRKFIIEKLCALKAKELWEQWFQ